MVNKRNFTLIQVHVLSFLKFSGIHLHLIDGLLHWLMLQIFIKNNVCIKKKKLNMSEPLAKNLWAYKTFCYTID